MKTAEAMETDLLNAFKEAKNHTLTTGLINVLGGRQYGARILALRAVGHRIYCGKSVPGTQDYYYRWFGQQSVEDMKAEYRAAKAAEKMLGVGFWLGPESGFQMWVPGQEAA